MKMFLTAVLSTAFAASASAWTYQVDVDKMTNKKTSYALAQSTSSLNLGFPYQGRNMGLLTVRQHPQYGLDVIFSVDKGQLTCSSYSSCEVLVKFDDGKPVRFSGTEPADNSSDTIFLDNKKRFIDAAKKAKKILVQVQFFQQGTHVLEFSVPGSLVWPPK